MTKIIGFMCILIITEVIYEFLGSKYAPMGYYNDNNINGLIIILMLHILTITIVFILCIYKKYETGLSSEIEKDFGTGELSDGSILLHNCIIIRQEITPQNKSSDMIKFIQKTDKWKAEGYVLTGGRFISKQCCVG